MTFSRKLVSVSQLFLDQENARHGRLDSQVAVIRWMVANQKEKIRNLAADIAEYGLSPIDDVLVIPAHSKGAFIVVEGNRRISALKLLFEPDLCDDPRLKARLQELHKKHKRSLQEEIECVVAPSLMDAERWIKIRHGGAQEGIGTVTWGTRELAIFNSRLGHRDTAVRATEVIDYAMEQGLISEAAAHAVPVTTFARILNGPDLRRLIGIDFDRQDKPIHILEPEEMHKALRRILGDLSARTVKVNELRHKEQRQKYVNKIVRDTGVDQHRTVAEPYALSESPPKSKRPKVPGPDRDLPPAHKRNRLIQRDFRLAIQNVRLRDIYDELKRLDVDSFPNAAAVSFRVFLQGCVDEYILRHLPEYQDQNKFRNDGLDNKITKALSHLKDNKKITPNHSKAVTMAVSSENRIGSIHTFHAYVHNPHFQPLSSELKRTWDDLSPFFKAMEKSI